MLNDSNWIPALVLAQDNQAAPAGGAAPPPTANTPTDAVVPGGGTIAPGAGTTPARPSSLFDQQIFLIPMLLVVGIIIFSMMGQRRERRKREAMISAIKKHDRVQTIGGVIGSVVEIKPDYVVLKVDESSNTRITFSRAAISQVLANSVEGAASKVESAAS